MLQSVQKQTAAFPIISITQGWDIFQNREHKVITGLLLLMSIAHVGGQSLFQVCRPDAWVWSLWSWFMMNLGLVLTSVFSTHHGKERYSPGQVLGHPLPSPAALLRGPAGKEFIPLLVIKYNFKISNYTNLKSRDVAGGTTLMSWPAWSGAVDSRGDEAKGIWGRKLWWLT